MVGTTPQRADEYKRRVCRAIDFINANLADNPPVAEIARAAPFSSFHFQRLFRALMGESVGEFTRRLRLETAARRLLFRPGDDITTIAFDLGFSSSQNFAKAFRKHFQMSPSAWRDMQDDRLENVGRDEDDAFAHDRIVMESGVGDEILDVSVRQIAEMRVAYRRHFGSYNDPGVQAAFDELVRWAKPRELDRSDRYIGIPWDDADVTDHDRCRFDACLIVPPDLIAGGGVNFQTVPAGQYAVARCHIVAHDFDKPWTGLMRDWLPNTGYQPADGPRYEVYHTDGSDDPDGRWEIDICLPVAPL